VKEAIKRIIAVRNRNLSLWQSTFGEVAAKFASGAADRGEYRQAAGAAGAQILTRHHLQHGGTRPRVDCLVSNHPSADYESGNKGRK